MDEILGLFQGDGLINMGVSVWNACCVLVGSIIGVSPEATNSSAWSYMTNSIYPIFLTIGISLMALFFLIGYFRESADIRQMLTLEQTILMFVRLVIANAVVTSVLIWIPRCLQWATSIVGSITGLSSGGLGTLDPETITANNLALFDVVGVIAGWVISLVFFLVAIVCGLALVLTVYKRVFSLLMLIPFAPTALSSIAGGRGLSYTATSWFKEFMSLCFEIVVIALALSIAGFFIGENVFASVFEFYSGAEQFADIIYAIFSMDLVVATVKGSNALVKRALGL
ncbi:MAG: hypothetical protein ACK5LL_04670 [Suipraeoptans sp.]